MHWLLDDGSIRFTAKEEKLLERDTVAKNTLNYITHLIAHHARP